MKTTISYLTLFIYISIPNRGVIPAAHCTYNNETPITLGKLHINPTHMRQKTELLNSFLRFIYIQSDLYQYYSWPTLVSINSIKVPSKEALLNEERSLFDLSKRFVVEFRLVWWKSSLNTRVVIIHPPLD